VFYWSKILYNVEKYIPFLNPVTHVTRDKSDIKVTGYGEPGFNTRWNRTFPNYVHICCMSHPATYPRGRKRVSLGVKQLERENDRSLSHLFLMLGMCGSLFLLVTPTSVYVAVLRLSVSIYNTSLCSTDLFINAKKCQQLGILAERVKL
jgi:hypothetical protein